MAAAARPDGILVPKVSSPADVKKLEERLRMLKADPAIGLWAMIETPLGVLSAQQIAATAREGDKRLAGFIMGPNDIARETRMRMVPGRAAMLPLFRIASWPRALTASRFSTDPTTTSATSQALRKSAHRAATWASTARR